MAPETVFLQPINTTPNPNFATATGLAVYSNYSQPSAGFLTGAQVDVLVRGGVAAAIGEAAAIFNNDPTFSVLFNDSTGVGLDGPYAGSSNSQTKVLASFAVKANQTFSFDFSADVALTAKEIENPNAEYNEAKSKTAFVVLDTKDPNKPKVLDYFGISGKLITSKKVGELKFGGSKNVNIATPNQTRDVDGNNGLDSVTGKYGGTYRQTFKEDTNITLVEVNATAVAFLGDTLIDNLGKDVIYGTIEDDKLRGSNSANKIYGSLGDDSLDGNKGDDILEGGPGNDRLYGDEGDDKLSGGSGDDILIGGRGSDVLVGGDGYDQFVFKGSDSSKNDYDVIKDFQVGTDKLVFQNGNNLSPDQWLKEMFTQGNITDTKDGVLFDFERRWTEGKLLLEGVSSNQINSQSIVFT
ncbi:calcium-binding protein [Scytonema tolypothrichoides VB-61278]|nr:calcium-binding protein [Scytonema tolypothrichoides VB-61278]